MNNSWLSALILRDRMEDIETRVNIYEQCHLALVDAESGYQDKYLLMGNTQIMVIKYSGTGQLTGQCPVIYLPAKHLPISGY
jgi:hypothetical protein